MKGEPEYPSPEEFVRASHGLETEGTGGGNSSKVVGPASSGGAPPSVDLSNHVSAFSCLPPPEIPQGVDMNMSLLQMMASGTQLPGGGTALAPGKLSRAWDFIKKIGFFGHSEKNLRQKTSKLKEKTQNSSLKPKKSAPF